MYLLSGVTLSLPVVVAAAVVAVLPAGEDVRSGDTVAGHVVVVVLIVVVAATGASAEVAECAVCVVAGAALESAAGPVGRSAALEVVVVLELALGTVVGPVAHGDVGADAYAAMVAIAVTVPVGKAEVGARHKFVVRIAVEMYRLIGLADIQNYLCSLVVANNLLPPSHRTCRLPHRLELDSMKKYRENL